MRATLILCFLFVTPAVLAQSANPIDAASKLEPGAYYWAGTSWNAMKHIKASGTITKHWKRMLVPGLAPQVLWKYRNAQASIQIHGGTPLFCMKFKGAETLITLSGDTRALTGGDIMIIRLDEAKDHRELPASLGGNAITFRAGLSKDRLLDITATELDTDTYMVSMKTPLAPGEYLLTISRFGVKGFDFGFHMENETPVSRPE